MGIKKDEVFKEIQPKLPPWLTEEEREEVLNEIGDYVVTTMLDLIGDGISPVEGAGAFKKLSEPYANEEKGGDTNPNLELNGDMLGALTYEVNFDRVSVGIWEPEEAIKAFGHITGFEGHPWLEGKAPKRKLLPSEKERFVSDIEIGIHDIIEEYVSNASEDSEETSGA